MRQVSSVEIAFSGTEPTTAVATFADSSTFSTSFVDGVARFDDSDGGVQAAPLFSLTYTPLGDL